MQVGVRFEVDTWTRYKRLCQAQRKWPNELLEIAMARAVSSGSVQECIDGLSVESESEQLVAAVVVRKLLLEIDELVDHGYWMALRNEEAGNLLPDEQDKQAPYPELAPAIEKTIEQLLLRLTSVHDKALPHKPNIHLKGRKRTFATLKSQLKLTTTTGKTSLSNPRLRRNSEKNTGTLRQDPTTPSKLPFLSPFPNSARSCRLRSRSLIGLCVC